MSATSARRTLPRTLGLLTNEVDVLGIMNAAGDATGVKSEAVADAWASFNTKRNATAARRALPAARG